MLCVHISRKAIYKKVRKEYVYKGWGEKQCESSLLTNKIFTKLKNSNIKKLILWYLLGRIEIIQIY